MEAYKQLMQASLFCIRSAQDCQFSFVLGGALSVG